jgi:hypothetical protein
MHSESHSVGAQQASQDTPEAFYPAPAFRYSIGYYGDELRKTNLVTGEVIRHRLLADTFKTNCSWGEVPEESLLFTGGDAGDMKPLREVVRLNTREEFAVSQCAPMLTPRMAHAQVYHAPYLYVLGGFGDDCILSECERYVVAEDRWEALPPLPRECQNTCGVVVENSLYALGGDDGSHLDLVQKLSLESLTWELMQFRLPFAGTQIPCFKLRDTEVYLVVNKTLCSLTELEVRPLKTLTEYDFDGYSGGPSYYFRGILYPSVYREWQDDGLGLLAIGSLSN